MRRTVVGGALVLLVIASGSPAVGAGPGGPGGEGGLAGQAAGSEVVENPFDGARNAEQRLSFTGSVDVSWDDARGPHAEHLDVRAAGGTIALQGGSSLMADPGGATMVRIEGGDWDLLWAGTPTSAGRPDLDDKYDLTPVAQPAMVASRPTRLVEIRQEGIVRERLFVDVASGLLLRREQLDLDGRAVHTVAFSSIDLDAQSPPPSTPPRLDDESPDHISRVSAPRSLPGGYRLLDAYKKKGAVQVLYSDGLYDMSVFEQRGALPRSDVPKAGKPVKVGSANGWIYSWAGGQVLLWHRGHTVYSLVSEAPVDHLVAAARALPAAGGSSLLTRLRRVCRTLVQPLAA